MKSIRRTKSMGRMGGVGGAVVCVEMERSIVVVFVGSFG
jgi:hypothetical protein